MSDDLKHFRNAVTRFDELKIELEIVGETLDKNFKNYKNISDISSEISENNQEVLESINTLQINAVENVENAIKKATDLKEEMGKYYSAENTKIKKDFDDLMSNIQNELSTLKSTIEDAVNDVSIDTKKIEDIIIRKLAELDLNKVDEFIEKIGEGIENVSADMSASVVELNNGNTLIEKSIENLNDKTKEINSAVKHINSANKSVTTAMTLAMLFVGAVIGFSTAIYFKIDAVSDYYFSGYDKKIKYEKEVNNELMEMMNESSKFEQWLTKNQIKVNFGTFPKTKENFISIPAKHTKEQYRSKENNSVTILK